MNKIKISLTIILTIVAQYIAILEHGYWGLGGNILVPLMCYLLFWTLPELIREIK